MEQTSSVGHWPEMERLVDGLGKATAGNGCCVGICGPAGVGKTYLLRKLEKTAGSLGFSVLKSSCEPGAGPKEAFSTLLTYASSSVKDADHPLFLLELLEEISGAGPVLLTIEDIHFADTPVISVLILMARNLSKRPVMIAFTYDCDKVDTSYGDVHPLVDGLRILTREGIYEEIKLHAMSRPSLLELVEDDIEGQLDPSLADLLWERSEGNPMVAMEAIRLLIQTKLVHKIGGVWRPVGSLSLDLPDSYRSIIESRLKILAPKDVGLLTLAAVAGRRFDPWMLAKIQKRRPLDVLEQLDRLVHDHHILEGDCESYRFSSNAIRGVILDSLPGEEARVYHALIGKVMETAETDPLFDEISEHYYQAGLKEKCVCFSILAAERFIVLGKLKEALREYNKIIEATADGNFPEERKFAEERIREIDANFDSG